MFEHYEQEELPLQLKILYDDYKESTDYDKSKPDFSQKLTKLVDRNLLDKPTTGVYELSDQGRKKADAVLNPDKFEGEKPKGFYDLVNELEMFLDDYKKQEVLKAQSKGEEFKVKVSDLQKYEFSVFEELKKDPQNFITALTSARNSSGDPNADLKVELVFDTDDFKRSIFEARDLSRYVDSAITVEGTIDYATSPYGEVQTAEFECRECRNKQIKKQDSAQLKAPYKCTDCGSRKFDEVDRTIGNVIELSLTNTTQQNESLKAYFRIGELNESLRDVFRPGKKLRISGIVKDKARSNNSAKVDPFLDVISYEQVEKNIQGDITQEDKQEIKDKVKQLEKDGEDVFELFSNSLAPKIVGEEKQTVKKLVASTLLGGSKLQDDGRIHVCVIGNPGTGKSDTVKTASEKFNKFYLADGSNSTGVGLTASVESMDNGSYKIKAGKLVYADKGVLAIDEFHDLGNEQSKPLKTAMQDGTFQIDKASQHAELPGEAGIIALANYKDEISKNDFVKDFMPDIEHAVKDRFDLMYCLSPESDKNEAQESIRNQFMQREDSFKPEFTDRELAIYHKVAKEYEPIVSKEADKVLDKWLNTNEDIADIKNNISFKTSSARYMVTVYKLSTMFARSRFSERVERRDAIKAIELFRECHSSRGLKDGEA